MTDQQLTPMQSFEQKLSDKLRNDIGDLIPEDALLLMIEKSIDNVFFKTRAVTEGTGFHAKVILKPSVFEETLKELLSPMFAKAMEKHVGENADKINQMIESTFKGDADQLAINAIRSCFGGQLAGVANALDYRVQQLEQMTQRYS
jgi:hypothetical protein